MKIKSALDKSLELLTATFMALLVIVVTWQVITRFILNDPSSWTEELAIYLMIWVGLLGSAVAVRRRAHLGIDYFVSKFTPKMRVLTEIVVDLLIILFAASILLYGGIKLVALTFLNDQTSPALGFKVGYAYLCVPIAGFFITMYGIEFLSSALATLKKIK